jgi:hypothetical protein
MLDKLESVVAAVDASLGRKVLESEKDFSGFVKLAETETGIDKIIAMAESGDEEALEFIEMFLSEEE